VAVLVLTSATTQIGTGWTGTAPGPGNPTVSGTITSDLALTDHIRQVSIDMSVAMQDFTTFGDGGFTVQRPGLKSANLQIDFNQDFAASNVDATFGAALIAGTLYYFDIKPTSSARGSTNPSYVCAAYVSSYAPLSVAVGDRAGVSVGFTITGTFARLTS
jgi:hypothetical protein